MPQVELTMVVMMVVTVTSEFGGILVLNLEVSGPLHNPGVAFQPMTRRFES